MSQETSEQASVRAREDEPSPAGGHTTLIIIVSFVLGLVLLLAFNMN